MKASTAVEKKIKGSIPQLFQDHLMCAGVDVGKQGACKGDSGGPLMYRDEEGTFIQIATVEGGVGECGDKDYPGIFVRLDHPSIWEFISSTMKGEVFTCVFLSFQYSNNKFFKYNLVIQKMYTF
jgi:secreted trypsin-like serine protease